jgi:RNA polymerase sigma factor (sigma-70 family)
MANDTSAGRDGPQQFPVTHWSLVLKAGGNDPERAHAALSSLCQTYWFPLYAHARRRGHDPHEAEDLTQEFFAQLLERRAIAAADPERGRFRSFLLAAMNHFLTNEWHAARAQKRGAGRELLSLDRAAAEERFDLEPADNATPDKAFDRQWALALLDVVLKKLEAEYSREGRMDLFTALRPTLAGARESQPYAELTAKLGMSEGAVKVAVHRLRRRYRDLVREEIAGTVDSAGDVDAEMRHLLAALAGS